MINKRNLYSRIHIGLHSTINVGYITGLAFIHFSKLHLFFPKGRFQGITDSSFSMCIIRSSWVNSRDFTFFH